LDTESIDGNFERTSSGSQLFATGRLLFNLLAATAEFETELRSERQLLISTS
jgi:DNA invertase Pin-like site-specific DNA recombinase